MNGIEKIKLNTRVTKENTFNALCEKYPLTMGRFCEWIDEYKEDNNWNTLFYSNVKFHDLPYALQVGIWFQFVAERGNKAVHSEASFDYVENYFKLDYLRTDICSTIGEMEKQEYHSLKEY